MAFLGNIFSNLLSDMSSPQYQRQTYETPKFNTPEESIIYEQEQSGISWHGVPLSELSKLAQTIYRGRYVEVDQYGFLVFNYSSNSRKTRLCVQCTLDENGQLIRLQHNYYPGQWRDSADDFVEQVNQRFHFW